MAVDEFPTIGILGGGQLGRMTAFAALRMGLHVRFLSNVRQGPMEELGESVVGDWHNPELLRQFGKACDVITVESEWAPAADVAAVLEGQTPVRPGPETLSIIRHKGRQKSHLSSAGLPLPEFECCRTVDEALEASARFQYPVLIKQYRGSYDGYGNATVENDDELRSVWERLSSDDGALVEAFVDFEQELAVLIARRPGGQHVIYPVAFTEQRDHRCHAVAVPAEIDPAVNAEARRIALAAVEAVDGIGITAVELFHTSDGRVLINEMAPRPHNTGHYSIEGCYTSQFENHVRAVLDWPLGSPELREPVSIMINVLGRRSGRSTPEGIADALAVPGVSVHIYGKPEVRSLRKMGHVTVTGHDRSDVRGRAERAAALIRL